MQDQLKLFWFLEIENFGYFLVILRDLVTLWLYDEKRSATKTQRHKVSQRNRVVLNKKDRVS